MTPNARGLPEQWNDGPVKDAYVWDKNGNLTGLTDTRTAVLQTRTRSMAYDARDRLTSMTTAYNSRTFSYTYDPLDNLRTTSANAGGRNLRHAYGAFGQLTRLFDPANPSLDVIAYTYDDRGNATSRTSATGFIPNSTSIVPDTANRVRSMTTGGSLETFTYDGHGRRTRSTTTSGTLVHFYTQAGQLLLSENPATPTTLIKSRQYHIYLGDRRVAQQEIDGRSYIHTDHIGSLLARTDTAGSLLEGAPIWEAWGAPVSGYSSVGGLRFAGHYTDRATGLSYMQQRYYDPYAGRFLAVDPEATSPGSLNRYWYANNNPYAYVDPDGREGIAIWHMNKDIEAINSGRMSRAEFMERSEARAIGAIGGLSLLAPDPSDIVIGAGIARFAAWMSAGKGFAQARRYVELIADGMGATGGGSGRRTTEFEGSGGESGASKLFNRLTRGNSEARDGGRLGSLGDGSRVQMSARTTSEGVRETSVRISSERPGSKIKDVIKVRFREQAK